MRTLLIDTDTASDDAVALIMALRSPNVRVAAITVVAGNVAVDQGTSNALYTCELCGSHVPVYGGAAAPLRRPLETAHWFHGIDGLGDHGLLPRWKRAEQEHAVDVIIRIVNENPGIEVITLGPLTNLALALRRSSSWTRNVSRLVIMGGAPCCEGNVTPAAEFNIWVDPQAAREVFLSGMPIEMAGWQLSRGSAVLNAGDIENLTNLKSPLASFAIQANSTALSAYREQTNEMGISFPDPVAMGILLDASICTSSSKHYVEIETESDLTRGMTVVDRLNVAANSRNRLVWKQALQGTPSQICWTIDTSRWKSLLFNCLTAV